ncbi:MAG: sulfatase-like hydrolase/transferase, partial [Rhodanobacter sp.]
MKRIVVPTWLELILGIAAASLLATALDPYLQFDSPLAAQSLNAVLPVICMILIWGFSGRAWFALLAEAGLLVLIAYADTTKVLYLNTDLVYADFMVIGGLLHGPQLILGFLHLTTRTYVVAAMVLAMVAALCWFTRHRQRASWWFRGGCVAAGVVAVVVVWNIPAPYVIDSVQWQVYGQATGAQEVGVAGNVMLGRMTTRAINPQPDEKAEQAFWHEPLVRKAERQVAAGGDGRRPDIVIVQSESLFLPGELRGFADTPVLPHIVGAGAPFLGKLRVPVFGGRTLQTEFEILTGAPISFYPGSMFAYYELVDHHIDALPQVLHDFGYQTMVIHPNDRGFWRRGTAMPDFGFSSFQDIGSFLYPRDFSDREKVSDEALTRTVLAELDAANG